MSAVQLALPTPLGIDQRPQAASREGQSSSQYRRAGDLSMIANQGAVATPALSGATGGACRPRDASRLATQAVRPPRKSLPPNHWRTAGHPWSG